MTEKPNRYECEYRGKAPGDAHSCCNYPGNDTGIWLLSCDGFKQKGGSKSETLAT